MTGGVWPVAASVQDEPLLHINQRKSGWEADAAHTPSDLASRGHLPHFVEKETNPCRPPFRLSPN